MLDLLLQSHSQLFIWLVWRELLWVWHKNISALQPSFVAKEDRTVDKHPFQVAILQYYWWCHILQSKHFHSLVQSCPSTSISMLFCQLHLVRAVQKFIYAQLLSWSSSQQQNLIFFLIFWTTFEDCWSPMDIYRNLRVCL